MMKNAKMTTIVSLILLASMVLLAAQNVTLVKAQTTSDAIVDVFSSIGGTTVPGPGTYNYANGTTIQIAANPAAGWTFQYWIISGNYTPGHATQYPFTYTNESGIYPIVPTPSGIDSLIVTSPMLNIVCGYGYEFAYQAVFTPSSVSIPPPVITGTSSDAIVSVLPAVGGTTNPGAGTYSYANGTAISLTATPSTGYQFQYWVISGAFTPGHAAPTPFSYTNESGIFPIVPIPSGIDSLVATTNPLNVICGYGYTFKYQPVFTATGATVVGPTPSPGTGPFPIVPTPAPETTATPTPISTVTATPVSSPTSSPAGGINWSDPVTIAIIVVVIIIIVIAVAAVAMRRNKK